MYSFSNHKRLKATLRLIQSSDVDTRLQTLSEANYVGVNCGFNSKFPSTLVASNARTRFLATNCTVLPFRDGVIDKVFSDNVVEHVRNLKQYIGETYRVLKPGGAALFKFYPTWDTPRGHHVHDVSCRRVLDISD